HRPHQCEPAATTARSRCGLDRKREVWGGVYFAFHIPDRGSRSHLMNVASLSQDLYEFAVELRQLAFRPAQLFAVLALAGYAELFAGAVFGDSEVARSLHALWRTSEVRG